MTQKQMAETLGVSIYTIERRVKKYKLQGYSSVRYDLMTVQNPVFCYLLGWFCTDGYLTKHNRVSLRIYDKEVIVALASYFGCRMYTIRRKEKPLLYEFYFAKAPSVFKESFDLVKTDSIRVPPIPVENLDMFFRGVLEGDGCIRKPGTSKSTLIRIFTNSIAFKHMLQALLASQGFILRSRIDRMGWELATGDLSLLKFAYSRYLEFVCTRKYQRVKDWLSI